MSPLTAIVVPAFGGQSYLGVPLPLSPTAPITLTLSLRTRAAEGLVAYIAGESTSFFSLELQNGVVVLQYRFAVSPVEIRASYFPVNDGSWHRIEATFDGQTGYLTVDSSVTYTGASGGSIQQLLLVSPMYIGGINDFSVLSPLVLQTSGLTGCITELSLNSAEVDILGTAVSGEGVSECAMGACSPSTCQNGGLCVDEPATSLGYSCQCSLGFTGENCTQGKNLLL